VIPGGVVIGGAIGGVLAICVIAASIAYCLGVSRRRKPLTNSDRNRSVERTPQGKLRGHFSTRQRFFECILFLTRPGRLNQT